MLLDHNGIMLLDHYKGTTFQNGVQPPYQQHDLELPLCGRGQIVSGLEYLLLLRSKLPSYPNILSRLLLWMVWPGQNPTESGGHFLAWWHLKIYVTMFHKPLVKSAKLILSYMTKYVTKYDRELHWNVHTFENSIDITLLPDVLWSPTIHRFEAYITKFPNLQ